MCQECCESDLDSTLLRHDCRKCELCRVDVPFCREWCANEKKRSYNRSKVDTLPSIVFKIGSTYSMHHKSMSRTYYSFDKPNVQISKYLKPIKPSTLVCFDRPRHQEGNTIEKYNEQTFKYIEEHIRSKYENPYYKISLTDVKHSDTQRMDKWEVTVNFTKKQE